MSYRVEPRASWLRTLSSSHRRRSIDVCMISAILHADIPHVHRVLAVQRRTRKSVECRYRLEIGKRLGEPVETGAISAGIEQRVRAGIRIEPMYRGLAIVAAAGAGLCVDDWVDIQAEIVITILMIGARIEADMSKTGGATSLVC